MVSANSKPKVLILSPGPRWDVVGEYTERLQALSNWIHPVLFTSGPENIEILTDSYSIYSFDIRVKKKYAFAHRIMFLFKLFRFIRNRRKEIGEQYSAIVSYDALATGIAGLIAKAIANAPLICEINSNIYDKRLYADHRTSFKRITRRYRNILVSNLVLNRCDAVKCLYPTQLDDFPKKTQERPQFNFFDVTDTASFYPANGDPLILAAGEPLYIKGFDLLIEAFKEISPKYPKWKLKIIGFFGDGNDIRARIGGHPNIVWNGPVDHKQMPAEMAKCQVFVLPSRSEGLPRVLLEAMAAKKARISTKVGGIPEIVSDGQDGLLICPENVPQLVEALTTLISDSDYREKLAANGYERVLKEFTMEQYCEHYVAMINSVIKS